MYYHAGDISGTEGVNECAFLCNVTCVGLVLAVSDSGYLQIETLRGQWLV